MEAVPNTASKTVYIVSAYIQKGTAARAMQNAQPFTSKTSSADTLVDGDKNTTINSSATQPNTVVKNNVNYFEEFELSERQKASNKFGTEITSPMYAKVQPATREQAQLIKDAQRLGIFVDFFENTSHDYDNTEYNFNGAYRKGHIYINVNSQNPYKVVLSHEVTHQIKDTDIESYNKLVEIAKNKLGPDSDFNSLTEDKREEELANVMGDILDNPAKYREVFRQNQGFGQKLLSVVQDMLNKLTGQNTRLDENVSTFTKKLQSVEAELTNVMRDAVGNLKNNTEAKYSGETKYSYIGNDRNGRMIFESNLPKDFTNNQKLEYFKNNILSVLENAFVRINGKKLEISGDDFTVQKNVFGDAKSSKKGKIARAALTGDIPTMLRNAKYTGSSDEPSFIYNVPPKNKAHAGVEQWHVFKQEILFEQEPYDVIINIRDKGADGKYAYLIEFQDKTKYSRKNSVRIDNDAPRLRNSDYTDNTLSQDKPIVNSNDMQNTENDTKKSQKTSKLYDNTLQKEWTTEETKAALEENKDRFMYDGITNKETYGSAKSDIESRGVEVVERELFTKEDWGAEDTAKALNLIAQHQSNNEHSKAVDIASVLRERMTKAGQATQALKIVDKLTPEGQMIFKA